MKRLCEFAHASRIILYETLRPIVLPFVHVFSTTWSICRHPIRFAPHIGDDQNSLRSALGFFSQAVLVDFVALSLVLRRPSVQIPYSDKISFSWEIVFVVSVVFFLVQAVVLMPLFSLIARTRLRIYCYVTAATYFNGAVLTISWTLPVLVVGGIISVFGLDQDCCGLQCIRSCGIVPCIPVFLLVLVVLVGVIGAYIGFFNWLSLSHAVTRRRVTLAYVAYIAVAFTLLCLSVWSLRLVGFESVS